MNKERVRRLERLNLMTEAGRKVVPDLATFEVDERIIIALKSCSEVIDKMKNMPELYLKIKIDNIQNAHNEEIFKRRLEVFIEKTKKNIMYGNWNDEGRLLK